MSLQNRYNQRTTAAMHSKALRHDDLERVYPPTWAWCYTPGTYSLLFVVQACGLSFHCGFLWKF